MEGLHGANGVESASQNNDYNDFLEDLEEDPELRTNVNIYRDPNKGPSINDVHNSVFQILDPSLPLCPL